MNYNSQQFLELAQKIEDAGGEHLDKMCAAREYELTGPKGKEPGKTLMLPGCGNYSLFDVPYDRDEGNVLVQEKAELCAVCDDIGHFPRFRV